MRICLRLKQNSCSSATYTKNTEELAPPVPINKMCTVQWVRLNIGPCAELNSRSLWRHLGHKYIPTYNTSSIDHLYLWRHLATPLSSG